jgi:glycosyltransferase involved in cell wall biosynthesis
VGGSHQALYDLVKRIDRDLYQPVVLFYQDNVFSNALRAAGVEVITFERERERELAVRRSGRPVSKLLDIIFGAIHRRSRLLRSRSIDLLHLNNSPATGFDDWLPAARLSGIPCITSVMSVAPAVSGRIKRALMRRFDAVIPVSRYIRDNWAAAVGIPAERLHVVHHGVDIEALDARVGKTRAEIRSELAVPTDSVLAVMVGNIREWKGQHVVLEALSRLEGRTRNRIFTVFAGEAGVKDAAYASRLQALVREHGLADRVAFLGPRNDAPALLKAADVAIHASVSPEPGGIAVLEAMALGATVIAADVGGHTEVMTAETGFTFDTRNPSALAELLARLAEDDELRRRIGPRARERMLEFGIGRNVRETQAVYAAVLEKLKRA